MEKSERLLFWLFIEKVLAGRFLMTAHTHHTHIYGTTDIFALLIGNLVPMKGEKGSIVMYQ